MRIPCLFLVLLSVFLSCKKSSIETANNQFDEGNYTFKLSTANGSPIINGLLRLKSNNTVIAEKKTDSTGKVVFLINSAKNLQVDVLSASQTTNAVIYSTDIAVTNSSRNVDVSFPANFSDVYTFSGNVTSCNLGTIQNGTVRLRNISQVNQDCFLTVENGVYNSSLIFEHNTNQPILLRAKNNLTNEEGSDTSIIVTTLNPNVNNLNTCQISSDLYFNYMLDNNATVSYSGNVSMNSSQFYAFVYPGQAMHPATTIGYHISGSNNLEFRTGATSPGIFTGTDLEQIFINGNYYSWDYNRPERITFTRYDLVSLEFIIGLSDFYIWDTNKVSHHLVTSFKVIRQN
jgi:hypothetical protein